MHSVSVSDTQRVSVLLQPGAERLEVLDDAVVDHRDPTVAVLMRVGVAIGGGAVRGPARVAHRDVAGELAGLRRGPTPARRASRHA